MTLYFLATNMAKYALVGTSAWFFLVLNSIKIPFSARLGLIHSNTLLINAVLIPAIVTGFFAGRWLVTRIPQRLFDTLLLAFAAIAALRLIHVF